MFYGSLTGSTTSNFHWSSLLKPNVLNGSVPFGFKSKLHGTVVRIVEKKVEMKKKTFSVCVCVRVYRLTTHLYAGNWRGCKIDSVTMDGEGMGQRCQLVLFHR